MKPFAIPFRAALAAVLLGRAIAAEVPVDFQGASSYTPTLLRVPLAEQISDIEAHGLTPARADDAAFFLGSFYRKQGFTRAQVSYEIRGARLALLIHEGPRAFVRSLHFVGNASYDAVKLTEFMSGVEMEKLGAAKLPYTTSEVVAGADRVRGFYASEGWLDATVDASTTRLSADGTAADIVVRIVEGPHYVFGEVRFVGMEQFTHEECLAALGAKPQGALTPVVVDAMQGSLQSWLRGRGYFTASVVAIWKKESAVKGRVPVTFTIQRGALFRVGRLDLRGLDRVRPQFMEKRFANVVGKTYDPEKVDERYRELLRTGLFRRLRILPVVDGANTLRLELTAEEAKQKEFGFDLGYGSYDGGTAGVHLGDRNFLRTGRSLTLSLAYSQRGFRGELLHVDPWFLDSQWSLRSRLFSEVRDEEGYSKTSEGVRFELARKVTSRWEVSAYVDAAATSISNPLIDPTLIGPLDYLLTAVGVTESLDFRDDPLNPRRGWIFRTSFDLDALDGQLAFSRLSTRYSYYRPIGKSLLAVGLRAGWIIPIGEDESVPIDLRYFTGGANSVRSFAERDLGPKDSGGHPLGGNFYTVANVEWDFPITGALGGAAFVDAGNLTTAASPSLQEIRYGLGLGLRYQLPIGPMRLDYGYNPSPKTGEAAGAIHFSFGFAF